MSLICTSTSQRFAPASNYLHMAKQCPGPGTVKSITHDNEYLDFTDPTRARFRFGDRLAVFFQISHGDPIHGYPNPQTMTNFVRWMSYFICISDGLIWVADPCKKEWSVVALPNTEEHNLSSVFRDDFLFVEDDTLTVVLDADDVQVFTHQYTLDLSPYSHNTCHTCQASVNTESMHSSSQSSTSEDEDVEIDEFLATRSITIRTEDEGTNNVYCKM